MADAVGLAVFGGAEWFFAGAAQANASFRQYLEAQAGSAWELAWEQLPPRGSVIALGFSWGAMRMALLPQERLLARIAVDGWCVPLGAGAPIYRLSHDWQTHTNGLAFGGGVAQFYADPAVEHLHLWSAPEDVEGWGMETGQANRYRTTAAAFLLGAIKRSLPSQSRRSPEDTSG